MLLKCSLLALAALTCHAASITDTTDQDSAFAKNKEMETVISKKIVNEVPYMPPMMIIGNKNGSITRCPVATPELCEVFHSGDSVVTSTVVHGEYLFASLESGTMLRCSWHRRHSCYEFNRAHAKMIGVAVAAGFIHAGLKNGTILRCQLDAPYSCWNYADVHRNITSLAAFDSFLYAGSDEGRIDRCSLTSEKDCSIFITRTAGGTGVYGLARLEQNIYGLRQAGFIEYSNNKAYEIDGYGYTSMAVYDRKIFVVNDFDGVYINIPKSSRVQRFASNINAKSISFSYSTFGMQDKYRMESKKCIWQSDFLCPPTVVYYDVRSRAQFEVSVKNGRLYDSQGVLLDTSDADESHSQKSAIFVMGPDGQLLVSKYHRRGHTHTSSLLAGSPVAGAGLLVVEQGRIKNLTACSVHYRPDLNLNAQVKESLYLKGYTDDIDSYACTYTASLCQQDDDLNSIIY